MKSGDGEEPQHRSRLETEVLEILERADASPPSKVIEFRSRARQGRWLIRRYREKLGALAPIDPVVWLAVSVALAAVGALVEESSVFLARLLGWCAVVVFAVVYARGIAGPHATPGSKRWRGREMDLDSRPRPEWPWNKGRGPRR